MSSLDDRKDEDEYDEEADSDFDEKVSDEASELSSDEDAKSPVEKQSAKSTAKPLIEELDSGDEATIKEQKKAKKKQKRKETGHISSEDETEGWRAKTRSMRVQEQVERKQKSITNRGQSTIDVNKLWEEMNKPSPLPKVRIEGEGDAADEEMVEADVQHVQPVEEMITIKRQYKFAGEVHVEEKTVPKSSAEAQLWLSRQNKTPAASSDNKKRPLRKISRFDPNFAQREAFRNKSIVVQPGDFNGPKLNVVEKSKMDWASHVDAEGLQDELDVHSKAKDAYLNRMDFLGEVEQRREEEARQARQKQTT